MRRYIVLQKNNRWVELIVFFHFCILRFFNIFECETLLKDLDTPIQQLMLEHWLYNSAEHAQSITYYAGLAT